MLCRNRAIYVGVVLPVVLACPCSSPIHAHSHYHRSLAKPLIVIAGTKPLACFSAFCHHKAPRLPVHSRWCQTCTLKHIVKLLALHAACFVGTHRVSLLYEFNKFHIVICVCLARIILFSLGRKTASPPCYQYHVTPFDVELRLSYFKSLSSDDFTAMWNEYDLYGPTGTKLALMVKQCKSRDTEQFM